MSRFIATSFGLVHQRADVIQVTVGAHAAEAPVTALGSRIARRLGAFEQVFENARLRRLELSWGGFWLSEWMGFVALSIYAFDVGGARALGALGVVRMAPAALTLPFAGMLNDRYP